MISTEVGAEDLMQLLKNYSRQHGTQMKAEISQAVVGLGYQLAKTIRKELIEVFGCTRVKLAGHLLIVLQCHLQWT